MYSLLVENGEFVLKGDTGELRKELVEGALIFVDNIYGGEYVIRIDGTELTPYWAKTDAEMRTYQLMWSDVDEGEIVNEWTNVCTNPHESKIDTRAMKAYTALVFEGDRVDGKAKTVGEPDLNYFNIGCAGHALAKMALTGHSYPGQKAGFVTTPEQRQTFLKMITADYCGDGTPFTVPGTHLDWMADQEWLPYSFKDNHLEARWTKDGATCLDTFRLVANNNETGGGEFPAGVKAAVDAHCGMPPACLNQQVDELDGNYMVSANPD